MNTEQRLNQSFYIYLFISTQILGSKKYFVHRMAKRYFVLHEKKD